MKSKVNYKQVYAIKKANEKRILAVNPKMPTSAGIYIFTRYDLGLKFCYVGQAKNLLSRTAEHLSGYQHIDLSIKKHGLYNEKNVTGWDVNFILCDNDLLNEKEQKYIKKYANLGYQLRNKTTGSQDGEKRVIQEVDRKGYNKGLENGYNKARNDIKQWFKYLKVEKLKDGKLNDRMLQKFNDFLGG